MTADQRISELENAYWRFQGAINAMETVALVGVLNFAKSQPNPFQWLQDYVEAMRQMSKTFVPDVAANQSGDRLVKETKNSIDAFLEQVVLHAGQLKGPR